MAAPTTLSRWMAFRQRERLTCDLVDSEALTSMSKGEVEDYNDLRRRVISQDRVFYTPDLESLELMLADLLADQMESSSVASHMLSVSGRSGMGKSTAVQALGRFYDRRWRKQEGRNDDESFIPVVYVGVEPATTPKSLMESLAAFFNLPQYDLSVTRRMTQSQIKRAVVETMERAGTRLVILDEVHNIRSNRQAGMDAATTMKMFTDEIDATFVIAGIDLDRAELFQGDMGLQLDGRRRAHDMRGYSRPNMNDDEDPWLTFLDAWEEDLPLLKQAPSSLRQHASYIWDRTSGSVGSVRALLAGAARAAILSGEESISRPTLEGVGIDAHAEAERRTRAKSESSTKASAATGRKKAG
ncbi:hypothetical protein BJF86_08395 [Serinicoccus sp. CNJ-927]|uniref:TniB family NTP-binding protein n=1 Tax=Serinicoccus sp. CNJ-927 TaxID=1904970 RepID=UPI0009663CD0|nr:TniB family NTP-binding protein [Serinicoccus sp. CNJ-927]OLT39434.1 hypothetical protein BJF86_08395 [Serinicoccus sp. CNJ-927]